VLGEVDPVVGALVLIVGTDVDVVGGAVVVEVLVLG
jgi:hypothetical protein